MDPIGALEHSRDYVSFFRQDLMTDRAVPIFPVPRVIAVGTAVDMGEAVRFTRKYLGVDGFSPFEPAPAQGAGAGPVPGAGNDEILPSFSSAPAAPPENL